MHPLDYAIVAAYFVILVAKGLFLARRAGRGEDDYFLGGRSLPWWTLGASGMSSNLDAAGTMTIVTMMYLYGLHGFWIEMRGGVVLPIAVFLAFMGKWHRRSRVMTTAEWMLLRFGHGWQGHAARITAAITYLVITVGMVVFFVAAAGKFLAVFLPFADRTTCTLGIAAVALAYTMIGGLYSVVWTDVMQCAVMGTGAIYIAFQGWTVLSPELLQQWPGARLNSPLPHLADPRLGTYELFAVFLLAWIAKALLEGLGGSGGSAYMAQRFYAARSDTECHKLAFLWTILFALRWPMVLGFALLAIHLGLKDEDPERVLPLVLHSGFFPPGIRGLVVAGIFAASMSTVDSTINAGASYVVRDIFEPLFPRASQRARVAVGYAASALIVAAGVFLALRVAHSIVAIWITIVMELFPAFLVPFALRWFWWRFNGCGFATGIITGFAAALTLHLTGVTLPLSEATTLLIVAAVSAASCLAGTFAAPPADRPHLERFYRQVRPMGIWPKEWKRPHASEHREDLLRLAAALPWQVLTFLLPMLIVLHDYAGAAPLAAIWLVLTALLIRDVRRLELHAAASPAPTTASQP